MDIAAMSVVMSQNQVRAEASLAVMSNVKDLIEQQGEQLVDMLHQSTSANIPHPTLGKAFDISV